jgi:hypothetical protein
MNNETADAKAKPLETLEDQWSKANAIVILAMLAARGTDSNSDGKMEAIYVQNTMDVVSGHLSAANDAIDVLDFSEKRSQSEGPET